MVLKRAVNVCCRDLHRTTALWPCKEVAVAGREASKCVGSAANFFNVKSGAASAVIASRNLFIYKWWLLHLSLAKDLRRLCQVMQDEALGAGVALCKRA